MEKLYTYHRAPTRAEIKFGYGATHYADFTASECLHSKTGKPKKWLKSPFDGHRYYRSGH